MKCVNIITPVKDSIDTALETAAAIMASDIGMPFIYTIYNDFSTEENTQKLQEASREMGFRLMNMSDLTDRPSPNYLLALRIARRETLDMEGALVIVESDVTVRPETIRGLINGSLEREDCGIAASVTVDSDGKINYPYSHANGIKQDVVATKKHCSFCCSLLTNRLLSAVDFGSLGTNKDWYDVTISHKSLECGLTNYLFLNLPVEHKPHGSRPWKKLKYTNPLKYYWIKLTKGMDKI